MIITAILIIIITVLLYYRRHALGSFSIPNLPLPPGFVPILGCSFALLRNHNRIYDYISSVAKSLNYKPFSFPLIFSPPAIFIFSPDAIEHVLKTNFDNYVKGEYVKDKLHDTLGDGIFNSDGEPWRVQRKTAANIFNVKNFKEFVSSVFVDEMVLFEKRLLKAAKEGVVVDLQDLFFRFTLDSFMRIGFYKELNCMADEKQPEFALAFDRAQAAVEFRFTNPLWKITEALFPNTIQSDIKYVKKYSLDIVKERRREIGEKDSNYHDLLTLFMKLKTDNGQSFYTDEQLGELVLNFIIAGRDTTAQALSWTFYCLSKNPEEKTKLLEEIETVLGKGHSRPNYDQVKGMKYAKAVFLETLRLHPSVPKNVKTALEADVLPDGTYVPKGANIIWSTYVQGRCQAIWGPDATEFKPQRWIDNNFSPNSFVFNAFNAGPRICLGKSLAELEGTFVLVSMMREFDIEVQNIDQVHYGASLTLPVKNGLHVKVTKRK